MRPRQRYTPPMQLRPVYYDPHFVHVSSLAGSSACAYAHAHFMHHHRCTQSSCARRSSSFCPTAPRSASKHPAATPLKRSPSCLSPRSASRGGRRGGWWRAAAGCAQGGFAWSMVRKGCSTSPRMICRRRAVIEMRCWMARVRAVFPRSACVSIHLLVPMSAGAPCHRCARRPGCGQLLISAAAVAVGVLGQDSGCVVVQRVALGGR